MSDGYRRQYSPEEIDRLIEEFRRKSSEQTVLREREISSDNTQLCDVCKHQMMPIGIGAFLCTNCGNGPSEY